MFLLSGASPGKPSRVTDGRLTRLSPGPDLLPESLYTNGATKRFRYRERAQVPCHGRPTTTRAFKGITSEINGMI